MDQPICDVNVTGLQIQNWLSEFYQSKIEIKSCEGVPIAAGQGFTSSIIRVRLNYENEKSNLDLPKSIIVKSPNKSAIRELLTKSGGHSEKQVEKLIEGMIVNHEKESEAYRVLNIDRPIPVPKLFATTPCVGDVMGVMVMEDLGDRAEAICDPSITLTIEQLEAVVDAVANLHAWCMTTDLKWADHFEAPDSERRRELYGNFGPMMKEGYAVSCS